MAGNTQNLYYDSGKRAALKKGVSVFRGGGKAYLMPVCRERLSDCRILLRGIMDRSNILQ
ncbi:hypothetical protein D3Z53_19155 [Lachnospiraceae bacterium]|nr:hypothetical protein [Lachnospiraceae bacterium]